MNFAVARRLDVSDDVPLRTGPEPAIETTLKSWEVGDDRGSRGRDLSIEIRPARWKKPI